MFLSVGESFTAELTDVRLVSPILGSPPRLLQEASVATVTVPEEAASSEASRGCGFLCSLRYDLSVREKFNYPLWRALRMQDLLLILGQASVPCSRTFHYCDCEIVQFFD